jgi:uncharacterized protein with HEPN domain/predicted nucleotidyltransferase
MTTGLSLQLYQRLRVTPEEIATFCQRWNIQTLALFGSVLRQDFRPNSSDVDVLVSYSPGFRKAFTQILAAQDELARLLKHRVDWVDRSTLEQGQNQLRKQTIFSTAQLIYADEKFYDITLKPTLSLQEKMQRDHNRDHNILLDILNSSRNILEFPQDLDLEQLKYDRLKQSAILYEITIIGEAVKRLSGEFRQQYSAIPWKAIAGMRDKVVHDYNQVDLEVIWDVITTDIPDLITQLERLFNVAN